MTYTIRKKTGTPKRRMTESRFNKAKSLFAHGLKAKMVADLVDMHYTTANRIDKCDSYADYKAANLAKSARRQELEDTRIGITASTPLAPLPRQVLWTSRRPTASLLVMFILPVNRFGRFIMRRSALMCPTGPLRSWLKSTR